MRGRYFNPGCQFGAVVLLCMVLKPNTHYTSQTKFNLLFCILLDFSSPTDIVERIRQLYKAREQRLLPVPWCEDFSFHLNEIFTRLKIVSKEKTRGVLTDDITDMTAIFKPHVECQSPRTVLIEGDPGMGKSTYCQKLAYDWATKQKDFNPSFPDIDVLLLLKCHEIRSDIWEAIDDQILPVEIEDGAKECFFRFIRENQEKVLLVLDGLDEMESGELKKISALFEGKELSCCHIVLTARHEVGRKLRRYCDTLWEIVGFTRRDAKKFIRTYFRSIKKEYLTENLLKTIWGAGGRKDLYELTKNPLNVTLLCILCEDFAGVFPASRTQLYIEIVLCVLRRYERKQGLSSKNENLVSVYKEDLMHLGRLALQSLRKGELCFEEHEFSDNFIVLSKFGFLSVHSSSSKRIARVRYSFLHKSFQEFFSGFYLACQILDGNLTCDSIATDQRFQDELEQVLLFMFGFITSTETVESLVKSMAANINFVGGTSDRDISERFLLALGCIVECPGGSSTVECPSLAHTLGLHLNLTSLNLFGKRITASDTACLSQAIASNSSLTNLNLWRSNVGPSGAASLSQALSTNSSLTNLNLCRNNVGPSGAASLSQALSTNSSLTNLNLGLNDIGPSGAASLSQALSTNSSLTNLNLCRNNVGPSGAASLSQALSTNSSLTNLNLGSNDIGPSGAASLCKALLGNSSLTNLDLTRNSLLDAGATSLSRGLAANSSLTSLNLERNGIGDSGAASLSQVLKANSSLTCLNLKWNKICDSGATSLFQALAANSSLTHLNLEWNRIGDPGAPSLFKGLAANSSLTSLNLDWNEVGDSGAASLSEAVAGNSTLTDLNLKWNFIGDSGAASLSRAIAANSSLSNLKMNGNRIGDSGAASLSQALAANSSLTNLNLKWNRVGDSGVACLSLFSACKVNATVR